jgi:hypothetical protein
MIAFVRNLSTSGNDDVLIVTPSSKSNTLYNVVYRDKLNNVRNKSICTEGEVLDMVDNVCNLLPHDRDPFSHIQITAPSFPSILMTVSALHNHDVRESMYSVIRGTLRNWPTATPITSRPVTRSQTRAGVTTSTA